MNMNPSHLGFRCLREKHQQEQPVKNMEWRIYPWNTGGLFLTVVVEVPDADSQSSRGQSGRNVALGLHNIIAACIQE